MRLRLVAGLAAAGFSVLGAAGCSNGSTSTASDTATPSVPAIVDAPGTSDGKSESSDPSVAGSRTLPVGFSTVEARITAADGEVCEVCLWLADDGTERARGLMDVTDLGEADGMAFRFDEATRGSFYMFQTPSPLSIAWFGPDGSYVGSADMDPCLDTPAGDCPLYSPDSAYTVAIEAFAGGLDALGIGPGSTLELLDGTESDRCDQTR